MKKLAIILSIILVIGCLAACGNKAKDTEPASDSPAIGGDVVGGWTINDGLTEANLPEDVKAAFDTALEGYTGVGLTPIAYLGSQVVAGTNHAILCVSSTVTAEPVVALKVAIIYQPLGDEKAEVLNVADFDIATIYDNMDTSGASEVVPGGWTVNSELANDASIDSESEEVFNKALEGLTGANYIPVKLLATQVVSGINYAFLAQSTLVTAEPVDGLAVVFVYQNASGEVELSGISNIDIASFNK